MAEIRTTRMRLVQWTEGTDSPQRVDFNETFLNVETLAAIDQQGTIGNRSTPSKTGMYYFATDEGILYRSDGQAWAVVGSSTLSHLIRAARTDSVSLTIQAITGQTADLLRIITTSGGTLVRVRPNGDVLAGALRISQAARTTTVSDTAPTDSAVTVDNNSTGMWGVTSKNTTGNTAGYFRAIRGTSTVFSVGPDGSVSTPAVTLTSAPSSDSHAVRRTDLTSSVANATYSLDSANIIGTLPISKGGTGRTAASPGAYPRWSADGNSFDGVTPANLRADIDAATSGHGHALTDSNITGVLPIAQGGTNSTTVAAARTALGVPVNTTTITAGNGLTGGGNLTANRTLNVDFGGNGSATTVARSDHKHAFSEITDLLTYSQIEKAIPLGSSEDLNTFTDDGAFHQSTNASAGTGTNYPSGMAGLLLVKSSPATMVYQLYWEYASSGKIWYRTKYLSNWYAWKQLITTAEIDALASVYAPKVHGHALTDSNITGTLPLNQGGTGATTQAAARTALAVPSTSTAINAGAGLSGGGTLAASRTLQVVFEGNGTATTAARSDHGHSLTDANVTGVLPVAQGGTGGTSTTTARDGIEAAYAGRQIATGAGLNGGGDLTADRSLSVVFPSVDFTYDGGVSTGSADIAARYNHEHNLAGSYLKGNLPWAKNSVPENLAQTDLDSMVLTGLYFQSHSSNATLGRHYPPTVSAGHLQVVGGGDTIYQTYQDYQSDGGLWKRARYQGTWSAWDRIITSSYVETPWVTLSDNVASTSHSAAPKQLRREGTKRYLRGQFYRTDGNNAYTTYSAGYLVSRLSAGDLPKYGLRAPVTPVHNGTGDIVDASAYVVISATNSEVRLQLTKGECGRIDMGTIMWFTD